MNNTAIPVNKLMFCDILDIMYRIYYDVTGIAVKTEEHEALL